MLVWFNVEIHIFHESIIGVLFVFIDITFQIVVYVCPDEEFFPLVVTTQGPSKIGLFRGITHNGLAQRPVGFGFVAGIDKDAPITIVVRGVADAQ